MISFMNLLKFCKFLSNSTDLLEKIELFYRILMYLLSKCFIRKRKLFNPILDYTVYLRVKLKNCLIGTTACNLKIINFFYTVLYLRKILVTLTVNCTDIEFNDILNQQIPSVETLYLIQEWMRKSNKEILPFRKPETTNFRSNVSKQISDHFVALELYVNDDLNYDNIGTVLTFFSFRLNYMKLPIHKKTHLGLANRREFFKNTTPNYVREWKKSNLLGSIRRMEYNRPTILYKRTMCENNG